MKASMYINYPSRSLFRGGQRTLLAIFCVAVGVMAIVALQLVGFMLQNSLTADTRDTNNGDIAVTTQSTPFSASDLSFFTQQKSAGKITNYTAVTSINGSLKAASGSARHIGPSGFGGGANASSQSFNVNAVDPNNYPIVAPPTFVTPSNGTLSSLLSRNRVVVTQDFLNTYHHKVGDTIPVYTTAQASSGQTLHVTIAGVIANTGTFAQARSLMLISAHDYQAMTPNTTVTYSKIFVTTANQTHTDTEVKAINQQFPLASTQTVADALQSQQASLDNINKFLEVAGLLALLIGGIGIVNTMQVLLSRRKTEIAMLKTTGYRRLDLYALFGLEAGLLGLIGGVIGAGASIGVSALVRLLMLNLGFTVPFVINPGIVASGVVIGIATALIFGLLPIVQAANIRPLNVIRDLNENQGASSIVLTIALLVLLTVLFCLLAIVILNNDVRLGIEVVYGTFAFLLVLSVFFSLVVWLVSKLAVPEHLDFRQLALILVGVAASALLYWVLPVFGLLLLGASLLGIVVVLVPRTWKVSIKLALRNIGRQRTRTTTTLLALFIGVFTIGVVLVLGQNLQSQISNTLSQNLSYNVIVLTTGQDTTTLNAKLATIPGRTKTQVDTFAQIKPVSINGQPLQNFLSTGNLRQEQISTLSRMEGYNLAQTPPTLTITHGRNLTASDANTGNVVISEALLNGGNLQMHLKIGDTITFASADGYTLTKGTVVGTYASRSMEIHLGEVLAPTKMVKTLSTVTTVTTVPTAASPQSGKTPNPATTGTTPKYPIPAGAMPKNPATTGTLPKTVKTTKTTTNVITTITYMKIDAAQLNNALNNLGQIVPDAMVQNLASIGDYVAQLLNSMIEMLVAIASLSLIAGVIIIANSVALAMLERRRELGIMKSVGYTSSTVLSEVAIENGIIGGVGALMAMLLATGAVTLLGNLFFSLTFSSPPLVVVSLIGGSIVLATLTAIIVAWNAVRVRPLEVLRYE